MGVTAVAVEGGGYLRACHGSRKAWYIFLSCSQPSDVARPLIFSNSSRKMIVSRSCGVGDSHHLFVTPPFQRRYVVVTPGDHTSSVHLPRAQKCRQAAVRAVVASF